MVSQKHFPKTTMKQFQNFFYISLGEKLEYFSYNHKPGKILWRDRRNHIFSKKLSGVDYNTLLNITRNLINEKSK